MKAGPFADGAAAGADVEGRTACAGLSLCCVVTRLSRIWRISPMWLVLVSAPPQIARSALPR